MELTRLTVRHFRNIAALDLELPPRGCIILGANGQGKTNLVEAIYYLVLFRSLRGARDRELVRFGEAGFFVGADRSGGVATLNGTHRVTAGYEVDGRRKKVTVDGNAVDRLAVAVGHVLAVPFSPADRVLVAGAPAERRRYLDVLLSLSEPRYLGDLLDMRAALRQRNAALRRRPSGEAQAFDAPFASAAARVAAARAAWCVQWAPRLNVLCEELGERGTVAMRYRVRVSDRSAEGLRAALLEAYDRDARRGTTTVGPHRDDLDLTLDGRALRLFGSAGQQRTAATAMRLVEAETLRSARGTDPVVLYDDVFAELDSDRQGRLLRLIETTLPGQAIIAAPRETEVPATLLERDRWTMTAGRITR